VDKIHTLGCRETIAILKLSVVLKDAHSTDILQVWYHSIGIHFILLHVKIEDGLSISVLKNRATCHKNLELEIVKVLKKSNAARLFHTPLFSNFCVPSVKTWSTDAYQSFQSD
jgi:hypothetical protein